MIWVSGEIILLLNMENPLTIKIVRMANMSFMGLMGLLEHPIWSLVVNMRLY